MFEKPQRDFWSWLEILFNAAVPIGAIVAVAYEAFVGLRGDAEPDVGRLLLVLLGLVATNAVARVFERYRTLRRIEEQTRQIAEMSNIELLRSARESGVVDLFPRANAERLEAIVEAIRNDRGSLDICGVALPTMTTNDLFRNAVVEHSQKNDVRVMLLKPDSDEAVRRRNIEAPLGRTTVADIEATRDWIIKQQAENKRFRLHFYDLPPMLSLIITDQFAFVEPYHFGRPEGVEGCIGGRVPMTKLRNLPDLGPNNPYAFFAAHYEYLWSFTRGLRVNLDASIVDAKPSSYVVLRNDVGRSINMDGWELTGQSSHRPYEFEPGFVWKRGERIAITLEIKDTVDADRVFQAEGDFLGNNTILRLTNGPGTLVAEWSIPRSTEDDSAPPEAI